MTGAQGIEGRAFLLDERDAERRMFQHQPVVEYAKRCRPAQDYRTFIAELVPNLGTEQEGALA